MDEVVLGDHAAAVTAKASPAVGAADAFDAFVASVGARLLRTAYLLTGDQRMAEDLVQDTLLRAWSHWSRVARADQPVAYVRRILVTTSVSRWRAARTREARERLVDTVPEPAQRGNDISAEPRDDELWHAVLALPARQRAVMVLGYYEDLADASVAEVLGCSVGTVKSQRAKALRSLRTRLGSLHTHVEEEQP